MILYVHFCICSALQSYKLSMLKMLDQYWQLLIGSGGIAFLTLPRHFSSLTSCSHVPLNLPVMASCRYEWEGKIENDKEMLLVTNLLRNLPFLFNGFLSYIFSLNLCQVIITYVDFLIFHCSLSCR